jgi:hypothetical protein
MDLIVHKGNREEIEALGGQLSLLEVAFPELDEPDTLDDFRANKGEMERRVGAIALFSAVTVLEAARSADVDGDIDYDVALELYRDMGDSIHSVIVAAQREEDTNVELNVEMLLDSLKAMLQRRAAQEDDRRRGARRRSRGARDGRPATRGAAPPPEADGDGPEATDGGSDDPRTAREAPHPTDIFERRSTLMPGGIDGVPDTADGSPLNS